MDSQPNRTLAEEAKIMDGPAGGKARYQRVERRQIEWRPLSLDQMLPADHAARLVWSYVESLDLSELYRQIQAVEGHVGRDSIDPRILVSLWLYATIDGVSSARRLDRLCTEHVVYRWLCGGVSVNYHTLSDFRVKHVEFLDRLLTQSVSTLLHQGLIELNRVAQDGMRVRASAGSSSFRRRPTLEDCLRESEAQLAALKRESEEAGGAEDRRVQAAGELAEVEQKMERREKGSSKKVRASTTDAQARKMKMGDGGLMTPMVDQIEERYGVRPQEYLVDGGFSTLRDIQMLESSGTQVYAPVKDEQKKRRKEEDPFGRRQGDSDEIAAWRQRMGTESAKDIYKQRAATAEFPNAGCRNRGLLRFLVRGQRKAKAVTLWQALAHNFQRTLSLRAVAGLDMV